MIDIPGLINGLACALREPNFPDTSSIVSLLNLDMSHATVTKTQRGNLGINGAHLNGPVEVGVAAGVTPRRELNLVLLDSQVPYPQFQENVFGERQRIQNSKFGPGLALLFEVDGLKCGLTASAPDGVVQCLFCEEPSN